MMLSSLLVYVQRYFESIFFGNREFDGYVIVGSARGCYKEWKLMPIVGMLPFVRMGFEFVPSIEYWLATLKASSGGL